MTIDRILKNLPKKEFFQYLSSWLPRPLFPVHGLEVSRYCPGNRAWYHFYHMVFLLGSEKIKHWYNKIASTIIVNWIIFQFVFLQQTFEFSFDIRNRCLRMTIFIRTILKNVALFDIEKLICGKMNEVLWKGHGINDQG